MAITEELINAMNRAGALKIDVITDDNIIFNVNFAIIQKQFPDIMQELVTMQLSPEDLGFYQSGLISYFILPDGRLEWKATRKMKTMLPKPEVL